MAKFSVCRIYKVTLWLNVSYNCSVNLLQITPGFLRRFCLKTGEDFAHFSLESGMVHEGTTIVYQCVRRFNSK